MLDIVLLCIYSKCEEKYINKLKRRNNRVTSEFQILLRKKNYFYGFKIKKLHSANFFNINKNYLKPNKVNFLEWFNFALQNAT